MHIHVPAQIPMHACKETFPIFHTEVQTSEVHIRSRDAQTDDPPATRNMSVQAGVTSQSASTQTVNSLANKSSPDIGKCEMLSWCLIMNLMIETTVYSPLRSSHYV